MRVRTLFAVLVYALCLPALASAQEVDCLKCHAKLKKGNVVHAALDMGCPACHTGTDARSVPHKKTAAYKLPKGLSAKQPDLCYACHDKAMFAKKTVHAAVGMGCTACHDPHSSKNAKLLSADLPALCYGCHDKTLFSQKTVHAALGMGCLTCHNPHSSDNPKLLTSDQPDLCYGCHDKAMFSKKNVHAAVGMGCTGCHSPHSSKNAKLLVSEPPDLCYSCHDKAEFSKKTVHPALDMGCLTCHTPHSSEEMALLLKQPFELCLDCHGEVPKKPHAVSGFSSGRHPLGGSRKNKKKGEEKSLKDPTRPDKPFYCGSCHNPHSTSGPRLFRFNASSQMDLCTHCHKM